MEGEEAKNGDKSAMPQEAAEKPLTPLISGSGLIEVVAEIETGGPSRAPEPRQTQSAEPGELARTEPTKIEPPKIEPDDEISKIEPDKLAETTVDAQAMSESSDGIQNATGTAEESVKSLLEDSFVVVDPDPLYKYEKYSSSFYRQMETMLMLQQEKLEHYVKLFNNQANITLANKLNSHLVVTKKNLDLLKECSARGDLMPKHRFETINFNSVPINLDVKEKELQIEVKTSGLPVEEGVELYVVAEFSFPKPKADSITGTFSRWLNQVKIEPKNLYCCSENPLKEYDRPISFFVDRGKSRSLKRKFKPLRLTFYEKNTFLAFDKKLGSVQVKIDAINDECTIMTKLPILDGRKETKAAAELKIRVREPLVEKSMRPLEEKLLILV